MRLSEFRPISLVNSLYKVIAKFLSLRLRKVLGRHVPPAQGAFVRDRQILDAILVSNESVKEYRKSGLVFKIDFEKAYDCADWDFFDLVMEAKGFGQKWRCWMMGCLQSVSFSVFLNGRPRGKFKLPEAFVQGTLFLLFFYFGGRCTKQFDGE